MTLPTNGGEERGILRFTRARKDTEKSFAMLKATLQWREESGANTCLGDPLSENHARILGEIPGFYVGYGKGGHPVFLDHTAVVPWDRILDDMGMKTFLYAQIQCLEWQSMVVYQEASRRIGKPITQGINVWDMKGLTLSAFTAKVREISSATSKIAQDNYPESLGAAYVVNAPAIFSVIWAVIKQFLDPKTVAKVHILGAGPKMFAKLKEALGPDCFLTEEMVCCKKTEVGKAELALGLQSAMAASQTWIRERASSGIPWNEAAASTTADASTSRAGSGSFYMAGSGSGSGSGLAATPSPAVGRLDASSLAGLNGSGGSSDSSASFLTASNRTASNLSASSFRSSSSVGSDNDDAFFDAEDDLSGFDFGDQSLDVGDFSNNTPSTPEHNGNGNGTSVCLPDICLPGAGRTPTHESQVKLIDGSETPSDGRDGGGGGGGGDDAASAVAWRERREAAKDELAESKKKRCCGCC
eukprot:CAMPEP_0197581592 /NCGR_PEP_ID=MMETSP1326-20131121/5059_1 /TAXON_ID=1155430 /ORGANISM="Genus nov. species nov., Strain RCC2288" /LENGTH=471 /DNA_ID=CAMNT_0043145521 /DNA_START=37 /DNA_END=1452 /DNA_ORIENTATION=-